MAMNTNNLSKYKDIISKSVKTHSGSPAVYQLKPKEQEIGTLKRKIFGEKNMNKINKTILLVGETGTGKSTLINSLVNYTMGVKFEDDVWFEIVEREERSQIESQTSDVMVYEIFGFEGQTLPYSLTIIDTPGYGDTRGIEHDVIVRQRLFDLFSSKDGVHEINTVGLVMKSSDNRLSDRLRYIFDSVVSLFGKDMKNKIVALVPHSDGRKPKNVVKLLEAANIKCAKNKKNEPVHFLFNNCQTDDRSEEAQYLKTAYEITMRGMTSLTEFLKEVSAQKLEKTLEVLNERIRLTACVNNLKDRIKLSELKQTETEQTQQAVKKYEQEMENNKNFTVEVDEVYKEKKPISGGRRWLFFFKGAVCCKVCEENCHYPGCTMAWSPTQCEVMKNGKCTSCTNKCPVSDHVKETWIYETKTRKVMKTLTELKEKYEQNKREKLNKKNLLENIEKKINKLTAEKNQLLEESYQHVVKLEQIALNVHSLSTHVHMDFLIEKMKEKGDTEKVQKLEEMESRVDEGTRAAIVYMQQCLKQGNKYKDIISKSVKIHSSCPAVYQLKPKKETFGNLRRLTVGEKNMNKPNKRVLLVGEIGSGKSTFINSLVNYTMGVKFEDDIWFKIVEREDEKCHWESQTSDVMVYEIFGFEGQTLPYSLTIIDTPGYGDTRGQEQSLIRQRLLELFCSEDGVPEVDAVGLVMKATDNRLSDRLMYVFNSVVSLFGKDLEKNVVAVITHSDGRKPKNALQALEAANIKCAQNEKNEPLHLLFNNCQDEERTEETRHLKAADEITMRGMKLFTDFLKEVEAQKLQKTVDVLDERSMLATCVKDLQEKLEPIKQKETKIKQIQETLKECEEKMEKNETVTVEVDEVYKEKKPISGGRRWLFFFKGAVCCKVCEENCHYPGCTMAWSPTQCEVMKNGKCTSCTNKCPVSDHVKETWIYETKTRKVMKTVEEEAQKNELKKQEEQIKNLTAEKNQLLEESYQHVVKLEEIALNVQSLSTYVHMDFLIEKMEEKGDTEKVQKLEEMKSRMDERTRADLRRFFNEAPVVCKVVKKE